MLANETLDSVFVATTTRKNYWRKKDGKWFRLESDIIPYGPRQAKEPLYREDTGLCCATRAKFIKEGRRVGDNVDIVINESDVSVDVNDPIDFWLAEQYWEKGLDLEKYEP